MKRTILVGLVLLLAMIPALYAKAPDPKDAATASQLILWSAAAEDEAEALVKAFNTKHPEIKVSIIRAGSGELITRLNAEQPRPQGDILLAIAKETFDEHYNLFRPYSTIIYSVHISAQITIQYHQLSEIKPKFLDIMVFRCHCKHSW